MQIHRPAHTHRGRILRFADADTVVVLIEGLWGIWTERYVRLLNIESWELGGADDLKARNARDKLNELLENRDVLVHLRSHGHDKYGRLRGQITVGETDLAARIVELELAWHCAARDSAAQHAARLAAPIAPAALMNGCVEAREGSTLVYSPNGNPGPVTTASTWAQALQGHPYRVVLVALLVIAAVAGILWLVHHRGKLIGLATKVAGL